MPARKRPAKTQTHTLDLAADLTLGRAERAFRGGRRIALLESIDALGSISRAAKAVGLSYKGAWDAVDAMNDLAEAPVAVGAVGGARGGGSRLTEYVRALVHLYRQLETGHRRVVQCRGSVRRIRRGAVKADVELDLGGARTLVAVVSIQGLEGLGVQRGDGCRAWVESSHVLIAVND